MSTDLSFLKPTMMNDISNLLFQNYSNQLRIGDLVGFQAHENSVIVHRVMRKTERPTLSVASASPTSIDTASGMNNNTKDEDVDYVYVTKSDDAFVDDRGLYPPGKLYLARNDLVGGVHGKIPHLGDFTILVNNYAPIKYLLLIKSIVFPQVPGSNQHGHWVKVSSALDWLWVILILLSLGCYKCYG